jgi:hypothetical protein
MNKHTPGPWTAYQFGSDWFVSCKSYDAGPMAALMGWPKDEEANARLIAEAPEMLKRLVQYRNDMMFPNLDEGQRQRRIEWINEVLSKLDAA